MTTKTKTKKEWETLEAKSRAGIVSKLSDLLIKHQEKLALVMAEEIGKPLKAGRHEVLIASQRVKAFCEQIPEFIADEVVGDNVIEKNVICYEPVGIVAVISPWNAPVFLAMAGIIPPLLCGNKIIWKPSEHATKTGKVLAKIIKIYLMLEFAGFLPHFLKHWLILQPLFPNHNVIVN